MRAEALRGIAEARLDVQAQALASHCCSRALARYLYLHCDLCPPFVRESGCAGRTIVVRLSARCRKASGTQQIHTTTRRSTTMNASRKRPTTIGLQKYQRRRILPGNGEHHSILFNSHGNRCRSSDQKSCWPKSQWCRNGECGDLVGKARKVWMLVQDKVLLPIGSTGGENPTLGAPLARRPQSCGPGAWPKSS